MIGRREKDFLLFFIDWGANQINFVDLGGASADVACSIHEILCLCLLLLWGVMGRAPPNAPQKEENGRKKQIEFNGGRELRNLINGICFSFLFFVDYGWGASRPCSAKKKKTKEKQME